MAVHPAVTSLVDEARHFEISLIDRLTADVAWVIEVHGGLLADEARGNGGLAQRLSLSIAY
jgi:hypothetical protein